MGSAAWIHARAPKVTEVLPILYDGGVPPAGPRRVATHRQVELIEAGTVDERTGRKTGRRQPADPRPDQRAGADVLEVSAFFEGSKEI